MFGQRNSNFFPVSSIFSSELDYFSASALKVFLGKNFLYFFLKKSTQKKLSYIFPKKPFSHTSANVTF